MGKRRVRGVNSVKRPQGFLIFAFIFGMLAFMGYFYEKEYYSRGSYAIWVYLMAGLSVLFLIIAIAKSKRHRH